MEFIDKSIFENPPKTDVSSWSTQKLEAFLIMYADSSSSPHIDDMIVSVRAELSRREQDNG